MHNQTASKYQHSDNKKTPRLNQPLLNCGSPTLALETLSAILAISPKAILERMAAINFNDVVADDVEQRLAGEFLDSSRPHDFSVVWFHGTRLLLNHTLMTEGLMPAHMMRKSLRNILKNLGVGLERKGENRFVLSSSSKPSIEGPFGNLFRENVISPQGASGNFMCRPELVDDIAGSLLGENYRVLTERFAECSRPSVVHFVAHATDAALPKALRYVLETQIEKLDSAESADSCSTNFDGGGKPVLPNMILRIEEVSMSCC